MKKILTALCVLASFSLSAQTLFYYGNDSVQLNDFLRAYHKNNTGNRTENSMREYLDLYIASRLKIREARALGYDTMPQIAADLENLRSQIIPAYSNDKAAVDKLVEEAYTRSQKDIHIGHIFIRSGTDAVLTEKKKATVLAELKTKKFEEVARKYSDDPSVSFNNGDLGWITVFTLPYPLENLAYSTGVGKYSGFIASKAGYHLFKNLGERRSPGRMKAAQILLAFPPDASDADRLSIKKLADSIYLQLKKGDDFGKLAAAFSNDIISAAAKGQMQEFGTGEYDPVFEHAVFALTTDGAISKPFLTSHGYHIVKRISKTPIANTRNEAIMQSLRTRVEQSDRMQSIKSALAEKIRKEAGMKMYMNTDNQELHVFTDSVILGKQNKVPTSISNSSVLLQVGADQYKAADWINFVQMNRYKPDGSGFRTYQELWPGFVNAMTQRYYEAHLEDYNEDFRQQLNEFSEGNLFFEIMQRKVWGPAQSDSAALMHYFDQHRNQYKWKASADAVIFYAAEAAPARVFAAEVKKAPLQWRKTLEHYSETIAADSSRLELDQIPNPGKAVLKPGVVTGVQVNPTDNTASFALVLRMYNNAEPRNFEQARGMVINDYQALLEKQWLEELHKKYPVRLNENVWKMALQKK